MFSPFLSEQVRLAHDGPSWHGASLAENLDGINAEQAASRPLAEAHNAPSVNPARRTPRRAATIGSPAAIRRR